MEPLIRTLRVERYRALKLLKIDGLGRVNLITGRNNTGKSSVLEAIRLLASEASLADLFDILNYREEYKGEVKPHRQFVDSDYWFPFSNMFNGYPPDYISIAPIVILAKSEHYALRLSIAGGWVSEEQDSDGSRRLTQLEPSSSGLIETKDITLPAIIIQSGVGKRIIPIEEISRTLARLQYSKIREELRKPCISVSAYGGKTTTDLANLWDKIALSDREKDVVDALKIIDPDIIGISMIGGEGTKSSRTAIVRKTGVSYPIPLRSFGDGMNRLFGIILSLVNAKDGLLLIDEFENGMHYSVQADAWRIIFKLARTLNIQVMATSHSWDAIESFQKAASEDPEEGVLVRLSRKGEDIIPTLFREDELAIATRDRIEVR